MSSPETIIHKYYAGQPELEDILLTHSRQVARKAMAICDAHPELNLDAQFLYEAAMLHDIGIIQTNAPGIQCLGSEPYICHGIIGAEMLRAERLPRHARVAERHTGTGITPEQIRQQGLPLPMQDYSPETMEEQVVCYADKFFSKTRLTEEKTPEHVMRNLSRFGEDGIQRFRHWQELFG